jgi:hypothetical protein
MKPLILLVAVAAALAALTASASSAPAAKQAKQAKQACSFASLPRASTVREQSLYGRIKSLTRKGARFELRFDPAWLLTGYTASRAAREDTGSGDVPNDNYTRDETHKLLAYLVPASAKVTILTHGTCSTHVTMARLARAVPTAGFWIQVRNDVVTSIDQQYHP